MIPYFARRRRFFFIHLTRYHCSTRNISQYTVRHSMQGNTTTVPLHLIIYSPAMTSPALIAAGEVYLYFITESATTALRYAFYADLAD